MRRTLTGPGLTAALTATIGLSDAQWAFNSVRETYDLYVPL